ALCSDDIGTVGSPLVLAGVPSQFVPCSANTTCSNLFGAASTCDTIRQFCRNGGTLGGCTASQGCPPDGTYTFHHGTAGAGDDWQDVLRQIYGGMNHTGAAPLLIDLDEVNADGTALCFATVLTVDGPCDGFNFCPAGQFCDAGTCKHLVPTTTVRNCKRN